MAAATTRATITTPTITARIVGVHGACCPCGLLAMTVPMTTSQITVKTQLSRAASLSLGETTGRSLTSNG